MNYTNELDFFMELATRCGVKVRILGIEHTIELYSEADIHRVSSDDAFSFLSEIKPGTLYRVKDALGCCYKLFLLPDKKERTLLLIGPYCSERPDEGRILEIGERLSLAPGSQHELSLYFAGVVVLAEDSPIMTALSLLCERVFGNAQYRTVSVADEPVPTLAPLTKTLSETTVDDTMTAMKRMEERYAYENRLIRAVELGMTDEGARLSSAFNSNLFESRTRDPIRNAKNYCIIMNTLLRKAAERGGVHPIYLDRVSSGFAVRIEESDRTGECTSLMLQMYRDYARLVRKHSFKSYSPTVKRVILAVESDLSRELSTATLAQSQGISAGYLSSVFKKETGVTLTEFIRTRRMEHAQYLLESTSLQIQTVALHCGILDLQYFSKLFRRHTGKTPSEYRSRLKKEK